MSSYLMLQVVALTQETPDTVTIHFERPDRQPVPSLPGQYLTLLVPGAGSGAHPERRAYSLSSAPQDAPRLSITVKRLPGGLVSNYLLDNVRVGQQFEALPPMGNFIVTPNPDAARMLVLVGSGSGITPLMSMLRAVLAHEPNSHVLLIYGNRNEESVIFKAQLAELTAGSQDKLRVAYVYSRPLQAAETYPYTGRLNRTILRRILDAYQQFPLTQADYYLCGPQGMMAEAQAALELMHVPANRVRRESFVATNEAGADALHNSALAGANDTGINHTVTVQYKGSNYEFEVPPQKTILDAALDHHLDLPYSCKVGLCATCQGKCLNGTVRLDEQDVLSAAELADGSILTCVAHPLTDNVLITIA